MAKMASKREHVSPGIFASDLRKPSVRYEEPDGVGAEPHAHDAGAPQAKNPPTSSEAEVIELVNEPATRSDHLDHLDDWRRLYLNYHLSEVLSDDKTEARQLACRAKLFVTIEANSTDEVTPRFCNDASHSSRDASSL